MTATTERVCIGCGDTEEQAHLEVCTLCGRFFCPDCAFRALGRRFCSDQCARGFFYGDGDDDDPSAGTDDDDL